MSASARISSICSRFDIASVTRPSSAISRSRIRSTDLSSTHTSACMPSAMIAELRPTTPPPRITTFAGGTPGTPPSRMPRPPCAFSSDQAPICGASRPATSLIGASSGRWRLGVSTVSYAMPVMPDASERARQRLVGGDVQVREQRQVLAEPGVLLGDRLLHLQQQLRRAPHLVDRGDPRADRGVGVVGEARADAGVLLDGDLVAALHELERAGGREGDAILALLDLPGNSDPHRGRTIQERRRQPLGSPRPRRRGQAPRAGGLEQRCSAYPQPSAEGTWPERHDAARGRQSSATSALRATGVSRRETPFVPKV